MTAWIALEGGEGSGKSTQAALLASKLHAVLTREPGGTPVGVEIRKVLLDPAMHIDPRAEALLMAADRAHHVASIVTPALEKGQSVVSDRSAWSSLAYQGYGRGLSVSALWQLSDWAMGGRWPDLAILIDVPPGEARDRLTDKAADRVEGAGEEFHARVRAGFEALVARSPTMWAVVDGTGTVDDVAARVLHVAERVL